MLIGSDGIGYYMYVRSLVIDHDLSFANEYARLGWTLTAPTATGLQPNQFAIGTGILWMPFFLAAHGLALLLNGLGIATPVDGYSYLYQAAIGVGSIVYGAVAMWLVFRTTARYYPRTALAAALLAWLGTNVIYYMLIEPSMSHMCSLFAVALFVFLWVKWRGAFTRWRWFVLGMAGGLIAIVRQPDAVLVILPVLDLLLTGGMWQQVRARVLDLLGFGVGFMLVFAFQMAAWWVLYGSPLFSGYFYGGQQQFFWTVPQVVNVLFSLHHGLYLWHPVYLLGTLGLLVLAQHDRPLAICLAVGFALQVYLIGAWWAWHQGDSFGGRMFISTVPLITVGLAGLLDQLLAPRRTAILSVLGLFLIFWNMLFLLQYRLGYIPMGGPITWAEFSIGKVQMLQDMAAHLFDAIQARL